MLSRHRLRVLFALGGVWLLAACGGGSSGGGDNGPPPINIAISGGPFSLRSNAIPGTILGSMQVQTAPATGVRTWAIQGGNIGDAFGIDANGVIRVNAALVNPSYNLSVQLAVDGATGSATVMVTVIAIVSLAAGQAQDFAASVSAASIYRTDMEQISCPADDNVCCELGAARGGIPLPAGETAADHELFSHYAANAQNRITFVIDIRHTGMLRVTAFGVDRCTATAPQTTGQTVADSQISISAAGQIHNLGQQTFPNISATRLGSDVFLLDISKRGSGGLGADQLIAAYRFVPKPPMEYGAYVENAGTAAALYPPAVDAYANTLIVYDYLRDTLDLDSFDDAGGSMRIIVDGGCPLFECDRPGGTLNASWNGQDVSISAIPDASPVIATYGASLDIVAHEWGHAIAVVGAPRREVGALGEAFADWVGIAVKRSQGIDNWMLGENTLPSGLRSLQTPGLHGDPDTYRGASWRPTDRLNCPMPSNSNDFCGIHHNNGVANKMFYLLAAGGTHNGVTVTGLGVETAIRIAVDAARNYWSRNETFATAGTDMIRVATMMHGADAGNQVRLAWNAVRVFPPTPTAP